MKKIMNKTKDTRYLLGRFILTGALVTLVIMLGEVWGAKNIVIVTGDNNTVTVGRDVKSPAQEILDVFGNNSTGYNAMSVARCESGLNPLAKSKTSTARGLFQIISSTWYAYNCTGDPLNAHDNAVCAKKIFDANGSWNTTGGWAASYACHGLK